MTAPLRCGGRIQILALLMLTLATSPVAVRAGQVVPLNLEQLTHSAGTIFAGRCVDVRIADGNVAHVTFEVTRAVKGQSGTHVTMTFPAGLTGLPRFQENEEVVLFLYRESRLGFSTPVGLHQGKFKILTNPQGRRLAVNGAGNAHLFRGLSPRGTARLAGELESRADRDRLGPDALLDLAERLER